MGIKGIYAELGPGKRVALTKLATDQIEKSGRPLRLAIDISIWQFQIQAARGGSNPAIRTLFYRLVRLLALPIQPVFVFDGPRKPAFKRNKRSGRGEGTATALARRLISLFGFQAHNAPGEAEAECALLQRQGIVDAVLSEDVDTIMFGCTKTLRNWSADGSKGNKTPTHVTVYDVGDLQSGTSGLDREGMVLVALMSGGDYLPDGIPGCGVKVACEAARAGFGKSLCRIKRADEAGLRKWRDSLLHELRTNESGHFRTRHKALAVPDTFPNIEVLRYYTHPVVSDDATIQQVGSRESWSVDIDMVAMRGFVEEIFDWAYKAGAHKLVRVIAPSLVAQKLLRRYECQRRRETPVVETGPGEASFVTKITGRRKHLSTDETPELRVVFVPADIAGLDLSTEVEEDFNWGRDGLALNSDDEFGEDAVDSSRPKKPFDPARPEAMWIPESIVRRGAPGRVADWETLQRRRQAPQQKQPKGPGRRQAENAVPPGGTLDKWIQVSKLIARPPNTEIRSERTKGHSRTRSSKEEQDGKPGKDNTASRCEASKQPTTSSRDTHLDRHMLPNPWTPSDSQVISGVTKSTKAMKVSETIVISSSPPRARSPTTPQPSFGAPSSELGCRPPLQDQSSPLATPSWFDASPKRNSAVQGKSQPSAPSWFHQTKIDAFAVRRGDRPEEYKSPKRPVNRGPMKSSRVLARAPTVGDGVTLEPLLRLPAGDSDTFHDFPRQKATRKAVEKTTVSIARDGNTGPSPDSFDGSGLFSPRQRIRGPDRSRPRRGSTSVIDLTGDD